MRRQPGSWSWQFFLLGAGFMLLETKSITQFALLWGSTWVVASLAIAAVLVMALAANLVVARVEITRAWLVGAALLGAPRAQLLVPGRAAGVREPCGRIAGLCGSDVQSRSCAPGCSLARPSSDRRRFPAITALTCLGAMLGGTAEYLSLVTGFQTLLIVIALCYIGALVARTVENR